MDGRVRMEELTSVTGSFRAQVLAARLESEGIDAQLRGALGNPYGLTMGDMARVDVFVPEDQLDDARYVLLVDEVDATLAAPREWANGDDADAATRRPSWLVGVAILLIVVAVTGVLASTLRHW
jgi:hypothetical protein